MLVWILLAARLQVVRLCKCGAAMAIGSNNGLFLMASQFALLGNSRVSTSNTCKTSLQLIGRIGGREEGKCDFRIPLTNRRTNNIVILISISARSGFKSGMEPCYDVDLQALMQALAWLGKAKAGLRLGYARQRDSEVALSQSSLSITRPVSLMAFTSDADASPIFPPILPIICKLVLLVFGRT